MVPLPNSTLCGSLRCFARLLWALLTASDSHDWNAALDKQSATIPEDALAEKDAALVSRSLHASSPGW